MIKQKLFNRPLPDHLDNLALLLFFGLALHRNISTISIVLAILLSIVLHFRQKTLPAYQAGWFLPLLFVYYAVSNALTGGTWYEMEKRLLMIGVPLVFWLNPEFCRKEMKIRIYWSYLIGVLSSELFCLIRATYKSFQWINGALTFNPKNFPDADYDFLTASIRDGNYFFGEDFSFFMHPIYLGLYIVVAQLLLVELWKEAKKIQTKVLVLILYFSQFIFLFLTSSKASIFSSVLFALYLAITFPKQIKWRWITTIFVLGLSSIFVSINPRIRLFSDIFTSQLSIDPNARSAHGLRLLCWDASIKVIKENWAVGVGEGRKDEALNKTYAEYKYVIPARENFNSHNQYLDLLLGGGLIGLCLYLAGLTGFWNRAVATHNQPFMIFLLLFSFGCLFENLLSRHAGVLLFSVFTIYYHGFKRPSI